MSKATERPQEKAQEKTREKSDKGDAPIDHVFAALEQRVEGLAGRFREVVAENARLKGLAAEAGIERDKAAKELEELRKGLAAQGDVSEKLSRLEAEREEVRARIERLLSTLEEAETA